jgi:hypothetical protein
LPRFDPELVNDTPIIGQEHGCDSILASRGYEANRGEFRDAFSLNANALARLQHLNGGWHATNLHVDQLRIEALEPHECARP